jgi:hypothetical protein
MTRNRKTATEIFHVNLQVKLDRDDISYLIHDVLMSRMHPGIPKPEANYKFRILLAVYDTNQAAFNLGLAEARHVWADNALSKLLEALSGLNRGQDPNVLEANFNYTRDAIKAILTQIEAMDSGQKLAWTVDDLEPALVQTLARDLKDKGLHTHISSGKLNVEKV